ncbi:hypothetical protein Clacol_004378 [Clathrus columnatus]|uniref:Aminopeptidase N n=1 Tax=Clathrus columnatus TaxID=1419009 RepID=A0AAV5A9B6_9AGAM|nr:hypothetical protein Clacol_004378 [Clathrus columnatus]
MKWWDNLWLNEGREFAFAFPERTLFPDWKVYLSFYTAHTESALSLDARLSSHAVQVEVPNADDIGQIFDSLSYSKAASVLRMLSVYTGEEKFLRGVSIYLKNHLYGNTVVEDLWAGIQQATGLNIPTLMANWVSQIGYPVLTVKEIDGSIHIHQDRFLITSKANEKDNQTIWHIPLRIQTINSKGEVTVEEQALLTTRETTYKLDVNSLYKLNTGGTGFYWVFYPSEHFAKLGLEAARVESTLSTEDHLSLLNDAMTLATAGYSDTSGVLTFIDGLKEVETEYLVWKCIKDQVELVIQSRSDKADEEGLWDFLRTIVAPLSRKLGYVYLPGEHTDILQLRTILVGMAAAYGLTE